MSTRPSAALVRFCLAGLVGVTMAARILCLCPLVEAAHAAEPQRTASHSCCHSSPAEKNHSQQPAHHSHADGCQHCGEQPQFKPGVSGVAEGAVPTPGEALALPRRVPGADFFRVSYYIHQAAVASVPPLTLQRIRTVVLLI